MNKKRKILWGGATASSQYEGGYNLGGKGLDTQDNFNKVIDTRYN